MRWWCLVSLALSAGCANGTALLVDLRTDLASGVEFAAVETTLTATERRTPLSTDEVSALRTHDFVAGRRVGEFTALPSGSYTVRVRLLDAGGSEVAHRVVALELRTDLSTTVVITRDCRDVSCPGPGDTPERTTCFGGRCVEPTCGAGGDACGTPECVRDDDCPRIASCATARCLGGACFGEVASGACGASAWCNVDTGCVTLPDSDAAAPDAARPDVGPVDGGRLDASASDAAAVDAPMVDATTPPQVDAARPVDAAPAIDAARPDAARPDACVPRCAERLCGPEPSCGTSCGTCSGSSTCDADGHCVGAGSICVTGIASSCGFGDAAEHWTGSVCCVTGATACVAGIASSCGFGDADEHWTGTTCCLTTSVMCVDGIASSCGFSDSAEHWTGTTCCVTASSCAPGIASSCTRSGEHWTGSLCCVD